MDNFLNVSSWLMALLQILIFVAAAPLFAAWVKRVKAWLQNRRGPRLFQPYKDLQKLFIKEAIMAHTASPIFRIAPYVVFSATLFAASTIPLLALNLPTAVIADVIVLVGFLALSRFFLALAGMDVGSSFGGMGSARETMISALAEPAMLMAIFTLTMSAHSTNLSSTMTHIINDGLLLRPSFMFALMGMLLVAVAETGRIPIDNPSTHLELTMIHEAMILEYSGRHLALMEWAAQIKLMLYAVLISNVFFPWGMAQSLTPTALIIASLMIVFKLTFLGVILGISETVVSKMRLFRAPLFLNMAFLFSLLGMLSYVILEVGA